MLFPMKFGLTFPCFLHFSLSCRMAFSPVLPFTTILRAAREKRRALIPFLFGCFIYDKPVGGLHPPGDGWYSSFKPPFSPPMA